MTWRIALLLTLAAAAPVFGAGPAPRTALPGPEVQATMPDFLKARGLDAYYAAPETPPAERRMLEHAYALMRDSRSSPGYKAALDKHLAAYRRRRGIMHGKKMSSQQASGDVKIRIYPNPAAGRDTTIRVETGGAESVELVARDASGRVALHVVLDRSGQDGPRQVYEYLWPVRGLAGGVYIVQAQVRKQGGQGARATGKLVVIK